MTERCYTDEELDRDAISIAVYKAEAQAERDAARIDANHHFAGDHDQEELIPYLNGEPRPDASECYTGEQGWIRVFAGIDVHAQDAIFEKVYGRVELRPKT